MSSITLRDNLYNWSKFESLKMKANIVTNLVSNGLLEEDMDLFHEIWDSYEKDCADFIGGLLKAYEYLNNKKLDEDKSLDFNIDFIKNEYKLIVYYSPFNTREFALNNINLILIRKVIESNI